MARLKMENSKSGKKQDLENVIAAIKDLNKIKNIDLANWQDGIGQEKIDQIKATITKISAWLKKSKGKSTKKFQAHNHLNLIVKKWGTLSRKDFAKTEQSIDKALELLSSRVNELNRGISKRNIMLSEHAVKTRDDFFAIEVIKNELLRIDSAINSGRFDIALGMIEFLEFQYISQIKFFWLIKGRNRIQSQINALKEKVEVGIEATKINNVVGLIDKVEKDKLDTAKVIDNLKTTKNWFEQRQLTIFAQKTEDIMNYLGRATQRGNNYLFWITIAQGKIDDLIVQVNQSPNRTIDRRFKDIITKKLSDPNSFLQLAMETAKNRNNGIREFLPDQKLFDINQTKGLLRSQFTKLTKFKDYQSMQQDVLSNIEQAKEFLDQLQADAAVSDDFKAVGQIIPELIEKLSKPTLVGQAI
jgi:hypothetical protein